MSQVLLNFSNISGWIMSFFGLILSIVSIVKVKNIRRILRNKRIKSDIIRRITEVYMMKDPLKEDSLRVIRSIMKSTNTIIKWNDNYEYEMITNIKAELKEDNPSLKMIQDHFKSVVVMLRSTEEEI